MWLAMRKMGLIKTHEGYSVLMPETGQVYQQGDTHDFDDSRYAELTETIGPEAILSAIIGREKTKNIVAASLRSVRLGSRLAWGRDVFLVGCIPAVGLSVLFLGLSCALRRRENESPAQDTSTPSPGVLEHPSEETVPDVQQVRSAAASVQARAKGSYLSFVIGAMLGGAASGSVVFLVGGSSSFGGGVLFGLLLSLAWIVGSNTKGEQSWGRLNVLVLVVFISTVAYFLVTGDRWIGPEPKGSPMDLGESALTVVTVYIIIALIGGSSQGFAYLWNAVRRKKP